MLKNLGLLLLTHATHHIHLLFQHTTCKYTHNICMLYYVSVRNFFGGTKNIFKQDSATLATWGYLQKRLEFWMFGDIAHIKNRIRIRRQRNSTAIPFCIPIFKSFFNIEPILSRIEISRQRRSTATPICFLWIHHRGSNKLGTMVARE